MQHYHTIKCTCCTGADLIKHGRSRNGTQRWRCNSCNRSFQLDYRYHAHQPGVKEKIVELTLNSSGIRDIGRLLKISTNTVLSELKKNAKAKSFSLR